MKITQLKYRYLIKQNKNRIFNYALYVLRNRMDAEDVTQEVMIKLWEKMGKFKMNSASSFIMKITHNKCIDVIRSRKALKNDTLDIADEIIENMNGSNYPNPEETTHYMLAAEQAKSAIEKLPANLKSVFVLYEINEMKYKEIAETLDLSLSNVKVNLFRARKQLQEALKHYELQESN